MHLNQHGNSAERRRLGDIGKEAARARQKTNESKDVTRTAALVCDISRCRLRRSTRERTITPALELKLIQAGFPDELQLNPAKTDNLVATVGEKKKISGVT